MDNNFLFLNLTEVLHIHENQIELYGGQLGLRDEGLLHSALAQPEATFQDEYLHPNIYSMAATYLFHLCSNHPFIDGNKRVATVCALVFLEMNDYELEVDVDILEDITIKTASGEKSKDELIEFFKNYTLETS